jgi:uncharacterized protein with HEPN domain
MSDTQRDGLCLRLIAEAIEDIHRRLSKIDMQQFLQDRDEQALTSFRLSIVGENANKLSAGLKARHNDIPWNRMYAFRNIVSHEYHRLDPELVWEAVLGLGAIEAMVDAELGHGD